MEDRSIKLLSSKVSRYSTHFLVSLLSADFYIFSFRVSRVLFLVETVLDVVAFCEALICNYCDTSSILFIWKRHTKETFCYLLYVLNALIVYFRNMLFTSYETYTDRLWEILNWYQNRDFLSCIIHHFFISCWKRHSLFYPLLSTVSTYWQPSITAGWFKSWFRSPWFIKSPSFNEKAFWMNII